MTVWTVWKSIDDWPKNGGGDWLKRIFQNKENAKKCCEQMNREAKEDGEEEVSFYIEEWPLY